MNIAEHKCKGKCPEFKDEQCNHCLINDPSLKLSEIRKIIDGLVASHQRLADKYTQLRDSNTASIHTASACALAFLLVRLEDVAHE